VPLSAAASASISTAEFSELMRAAGRFSGVDTLTVAVAVSGGVDSMTLLALTSDWGAETGTAITALTVDHGLRTESSTEAQLVAAWCSAHDIPHETLVWVGEKPARGIQAAARTARYALLEDWCRAHGCRDLLVAHSQNDQVETFLMRMSRGSGVDGLAAMPLVSDRDGVRLIRPLLDVPRWRINATAAARALETITDPSNLDRRFARIRMRDKLKQLVDHGVPVAAIANTVRIFGDIRGTRENAIAELANEIVDFHQEGYAAIARAGLGGVEPEMAKGLVSAVLTSIGGLDYPPRRESLDRLMADLLYNRDFLPRTLGNCVIGVRKENFLIRREHHTVRHSLAVDAGRRVVWDGRFAIVFAPKPDRVSGTGVYRLSALGEDGWQQIVSLTDRTKLTAYRGIPGPVRYALPAIWRDENVVEVPHLRYKSGQLIEKIIKNTRFLPKPPLNGQLFRVV